MNSTKYDRRRRKRFLKVAIAILGIFAALNWNHGKAYWQRWRAQRAYSARDYERAKSHLDQAFQLHSKSPAAHFLMARVYRHLDQHGPATQSLQLAADFGTDVQQIQREQLLLFAQRGQLREVESQLGELLATATADQREICEAFVRGYLANLRLTEAQSLLTAWTNDFPSDAEAWFLQGSLDEITSKFSEAASAYRRAAALRPDRIDIQLHLSEMLVELREIDENHRVLQHCLKIRPNDPAVLLAWARSQQSQGQLDEAQTTLALLLQLDANNVEAQLLAGQIALARQQFDDAIRLLEHVISKRPHDSAARYALANAYLAAGRSADAKPHLQFVDEAQEPLNRVEELVVKTLEEPKNESLRFEIGSLLWKYGSADDAARWMFSVLQLNPHHEGARQIMAEYQKQLGRIGSAGERRPVAVP